MFYKFPYFEDRPHIPVAIESKGVRKRFLPLLDSGADFSVFAKSDAILLGLDWDQGKVIVLENADGTYFKGRTFKVKVVIQDVVIQTDLCFSEKSNSMRLLGRKDLFKEFEILIDEKETVVKLKKK